MSARTLILILLFASGAGVRAAELEQAAPPPLPPSPVEQFRQWLEMPAEEREKQLADWPEANQQVLRAKLDSYARLDPDERERRLAMLDLRYYIGPLLAQPPSPERELRVDSIPEEYRELVRDRLQQWDQLPPAMKARMMENELALQYLTRIRRKSPPEQALQQFNASMDEDLKQRLQNWQNVPTRERLNLSVRLNRFFELPTEERQKTLRTLSESERQEIQRSLDALNRMSPQQRQLCIQSFGKLAAMSPSEQALFLHNAARWQAMTREERETWKNLVSSLPPLPPYDVVPPPLPDSAPPIPPTAAATNAGR